MNNDLPPFMKNRQCHEVLRIATRLLEEAGFSQVSIYEDANLHITPQSFNKFVNGISKRFVRGKEYWYWLMECHPDVLRDAIQEKDNQFVRNPSTRELNKLTNQAPYDYNTLERMQGRFLVYRKRFSEPDSIMVMVLNCGINDDKTRFSLTSIFGTAAKGIEEHTGYGSIVPHKESKMVSFYGAVQKWNASFMMSVQPTNTSSDESISEAFGGIMVATPSYAQPTSYAESYLVRTYDDVSPFIIPKSELLSSLKNGQIVRHLKL